MNRNNKKRKQTVSMLLTLFLLISCIIFAPITAYAAGWLDYAQDLTMGNTVSGSIKTGDYRGLPEVNSGNYYWHIYKISMQRFEVGQLPAVFCRLQRLSGGFVNDNAALIAPQELFFVLCLFVLHIDRLCLLVCGYVFHQKGYVGQPFFQAFQRGGGVFAFRMHFIKNRLQLLIL